jgi:hypothetical protein
MTKPYIDIENTDEYIVRKFDENIDPIELMWHRDDEDRLVEIIDPGQGWKFQFENELPWDLEPQMSICILKHEWHRIIKGKENLLVKIHKLKEE